jgi:hypothetical protein
MNHNQLNLAYSYISFFRVFALNLVISFQMPERGIYPLGTFSPITDKLIHLRTMRRANLVGFNRK